MKHYDKETDCAGTTFETVMLDGECVHSKLNHCYAIVCTVCGDDVDDE